jgi:hypothetical protein
MGPPSYMWSVVDRNVVMRHIPVHNNFSDTAYRLTDVKKVMCEYLPFTEVR